MVTAETEADLPEIYCLVNKLPVMRWSLFFLVAVGRGKTLREIAPDRSESLHHWLYDLSKETPFTVATTEAPDFRRVALTRMQAEGIPMARIRQTPLGRGFGIRDGNGIMFISHTGEVYPSGFLPQAAGNVRTADIVEIYRESELFRRIRETASFKGRCGRCEFREICGGSRARACAASGDYLDEDPACSYQPGKEEKPCLGEKRSDGLTTPAWPSRPVSSRRAGPMNWVPRGPFNRSFVKGFPPTPSSTVISPPSRTANTVKG